MVTEPSPTTTVDESDSPSTDNSSNIVVNGLLGGIVGIVLSFVPFSPVIGGGFASYLHGGTTRSGMKVGGIAGLVMLVPLVVFGTMISVFMLGLGGSAIGFLLLGFIMFVIGGVYTVGLSVLGGYLGIYVKQEL